MASVMEAIRKLIKVALICAAVFLVGWLIFRGVSSFIDSLEPENPYPTDPVEATDNFFYCLHEQDYQSCYRALVTGRKVTTAVDRHTRERYFGHFDRIRVYLTETSGENFLDGMDISTDGKLVTFKNDVVLTVKFEISMDSKKIAHYGIDQINEFPMDVMPKIGAEKYHRSVGRMIEGMENTEEIDDASEVIRDKPGESKRQRLTRMIDSFKRARQLDTKTTILKFIVLEFKHEKNTRQFLTELANDQNQPPQLRAKAMHTLNQLN